MEDLNIYKEKKILITGHTGFKGAWLSIWLNKLGAKVIGFSLEEHPNDYIYKNAKLNKILFADEKGDINNYQKLKEIFQKHNPDGVFHLAAQSLVRLSYNIPQKTFQTNTLGTVNVLECIKETTSTKMGVMITTDKCYKIKEIEKGYKEEDELGGIDPYSSSKACAEIVINSFRESFFKKSNQLVASARAGNVVGGGDFAEDRLIPDCVKAQKKNELIKVRNPTHTRPWQFILEPLYGYLLLGKKLFNQKKEFAEPWNFGPDQTIEVKDVVNLFIKHWGDGKWIDVSNADEKDEAKILNLDNSKAKNKLKWYPSYDIDQTIKKTVNWYKSNKDAYELCREQIKDFEENA